MADQAIGPQPGASPLWSSVEMLTATRRMVGREGPDGATSTSDGLARGRRDASSSIHARLPRCATPVTGGLAHDVGRSTSEADAVSRGIARAVVVSLAVAVAAGCANVQVSSPLDDPRAPATAAVKRCSPDDPNRSVWFCKVGQLIYNIVGSGQVSGGYTVR